MSREQSSTQPLRQPASARSRADFFRRPYRLGRKQVRGRFAIPSGIRCTHASTIAKCFAEVAPVGVVTTKSISLAPRAGYREPIFARYAPGCYINAVGLANPGAEAFLAEFDGLATPPDKFLLVSIFGGNLEEYLGAAEVLQPIADGFELNMSCPHAKGYGAEIGQDLELVAAITRAVAARSAGPVFVKLSATLHRLAETAKAAIEAGAAGITVTNTIGPAVAAVGEDPILYNRRGGLSGDGIRPLGLRAVEQVREAVGREPVIIGMGGIGTAEHVAQFRKAGADVFGIGSALAGLDSGALRDYFDHLQRQLTGAAAAGETRRAVGEVDMSYFPTKLARRRELAPNLFAIELENLPRRFAPGELAGKYFFLTVPGVGEKPFAVFSPEQRSVVIRQVGVFTRYLHEAALGSRILLRGPYGAPLPEFRNQAVVLVGGGTGIASLLEVAHAYRSDNEVTFLLGGRSEAELFGLEAFRRLGPVHLATEDGSAGQAGLVTSLLQRRLAAEPAGRRGRLVFLNCGPEAMVEACFALERAFAPPERILGAIEYVTSCGVGICGKCAAPSGCLTCIDGPFLPMEEFRPRREHR